MDVAVLLRRVRPQSEHPVDVGQRTEARIVAELVARGHSVLLPYGINHRYDLVVDFEGRFVRAQCKTGRLRKGVVSFNTRSCRSNTRVSQTRSYHGEADVFLVYCHDLPGRFFVIPVSDSGNGQMSLRIDEPLNKQALGIRWAKDYQVPA